MFLTRIVARCFTGLRHIPIVGPLNSVLGGCVGAVEGVLYLYLMVAIASLVLALTAIAPYLTGGHWKHLVLRLFYKKCLRGAADAGFFGIYCYRAGIFAVDYRRLKFFSARSFFHSQFTFAFYNEPKSKMINNHDCF